MLYFEDGGVLNTVASLAESDPQNWRLKRLAQREFFSSYSYFNTFFTIVQFNMFDSELAV